MDILDTEAGKTAGTSSGSAAAKATESGRARSAQAEPAGGSPAQDAPKAGPGRRAVPLVIEATFCPADVADPFETVAWDLRTAAIKGEGGEVVFEQRDCEVPASWSQLATNVVANKYFYGEVNTRRAGKERAAVDPSRLPHDRRLGPGGRLLRHGRRRRALLSRPGLALPAPVRLVQFAGVVQRGACITSTA